MEQYHTAVLYHGSDVAKKWKWASPDHAGTKPLRIVRSDLVEQDRREKVVMEHVASSPDSRTAAETWASYTGRTVGYMSADGVIRSKEGTPVEKTPDMVIVKV